MTRLSCITYIWITYMKVNVDVFSNVIFQFLLFPFRWVFFQNLVDTKPNAGSNICWKNNYGFKNTSLQSDCKPFLGSIPFTPSRLTCFANGDGLQTAAFLTIALLGHYDTSYSLYQSNAHNADQIPISQP